MNQRQKHQKDKTKQERKGKNTKYKKIAKKKERDDEKKKGKEKGGAILIKQNKTEIKKIPQPPSKEMGTRVTVTV